jgi:hypothetical protein
MYQIATTVQRESGSHTLEAITAVKVENEFDKEDEGDVAAFQYRVTSYASRQNCSSIN